MCNILLKMPVELSHVHWNGYFIVNFVKPAVVLLLMNKFDFFLTLSVYTTIFPIEFVCVISEPVFITETQIFWRWRVFIGYYGLLVVRIYEI